MRVAKRIDGTGALFDPAEYVADDGPSSAAAVGTAPALLLTATGSSRGRARGEVCTSTTAALAACARGCDVILAVTETTPADQHVLARVAGVLTARGGNASHASILAREHGIPAVCDALELTVGDGWLRVGPDGPQIADGTVLTLDGGTGEVWLGSAPAAEQLRLGFGRPPAATGLGGVFDGALDGLFDGPRRRLRVLANASSADAARRARDLGAAGIGLCRIEHVLSGPDEIGLVQRLIADDGDTAAAVELRRVLRDRLAELLLVMDGLPVTIRLLDAPLHEIAPAGAGAAGLWHQHNPMLGVRGIRLARLRPALYEAQVSAIADAARADPDVGVLVPMVSGAAELRWARSMVESTWAAAGAGGTVRIGTMIETPRAALRAGALAAAADFFSIGTNDLTQLAFGFSRDDVGATVIGPYVDDGLLDADPFVALDVDAVGELVAIACLRGRAVKPDLDVTLCGEHGADEESAAAAYALGVDAVSCAPAGVPGALEVARALDAERGDTAPSGRGPHPSPEGRR
ncbi:MAG TPA: hypothetical protein DEP66_05345 [Acidimicrobiaceae bacterium]|nr:hypothetical protein [Acidimicrobiaceae bacterium]